MRQYCGFDREEEGVLRGADGGGTENVMWHINTLKTAADPAWLNIAVLLLEE
jgi:hypothetical protein